MRVTLLTAVISTLALATGCDVEGERAEPAASPPGFPFVAELQRPLARLLDSNVTDEAAQWNFRSLHRPDSIAAFYRRQLLAIGFRISGDTREGGAVSLYARRGREAIWVRAEPDPIGSRFVLVAGMAKRVGADPDSAAADTTLRR